jgi:hypothetical protein
VDRHHRPAERQVRLTATADPGHLVKEISYANNAAWAKIRTTDTSVTVLRYGPGA